MTFLRRIRCTACVLLMMNIYFIDRLLADSAHNGALPFRLQFAVTIPARILCIIFISLIYILNEFFPCYKKEFSARLNALSGGYELIITSLYALVLEITGYYTYIRFFISNHGGFTGTPQCKTAIIGGIMAWFFLLIHYLNGFWRTAFCSSQLGIALRVLMFLFWWLIPINIILFLKWCRIVQREVRFEHEKNMLDSTRVESQICATHYPVVMVHGIFFRDWQFLNYWGRIPQALKKNGAHVYYGGQQSSRCIADSAAEIKAEILHVLDKTGAEKVNVIAHSKGGLDTRYAISCLGMDDKIASLTTINTPHRGCPFVDSLLDFFPDSFAGFIAARYNSVFKKLGDNAPDFLGGVKDLTASSCKVFNEQVKDSPKVYYQSTMSKMHSAMSAGFPLNIGYLLVKKYEGDNDGLVSVPSAVWGNYLGLSTAGKKGISHGDMIDLTRKNIKGFDVSEFYVQIIAKLKDMGF